MIRSVATYFAAKKGAPEETLLVEKEARELNEEHKEALDAVTTVYQEGKQVNEAMDKMLKKLKKDVSVH